MKTDSSCSLRLEGSEYRYDLIITSQQIAFVFVSPLWARADAALVANGRVAYSESADGCTVTVRPRRSEAEMPVNVTFKVTDGRNVWQMTVRFDRTSGTFVQCTVKRICSSAYGEGLARLEYNHGLGEGLTARVQDFGSVAVVILPDSIALTTSDVTYVAFHMLGAETEIVARVPAEGAARYVVDLDYHNKDREWRLTFHFQSGLFERCEFVETTTAAA